jgi:thiosulfate reductase cytochrome b subunit
VRVTHWVNAPALAIMIGSGLRIFNAYPAFARRGDSFCCYPFEGTPIPAWLTFGGWLAGARHWHFAAMWLLVANGLCTWASSTCTASGAIWSRAVGWGATRGRW